jgi:capsule biosynthesis phosphatase
MKRLIIDIDDTLCHTFEGKYSDACIIDPIKKKIIIYKNAGFEIVLYSSRNVKTYDGNIGKITAHTVPALVEWLDRAGIPYDEIYMGKPWCGTDGFYVDDKAIRPSEFLIYDYDEIKQLLNDSAEVLSDFGKIDLK